MLYIFLSLANDLSVALYQNNGVTSTRNPMIHIHINKNLWKLLIHFPAFSFFKCHNFFNQVGPDNKITHVRCSKPPYIIQNQISVFVLTLSKIVWSVSNQMCTLLYLFLPENHPIFKNSRKNSKNWPLKKPLKSIAENDSSLLQCIWIVCTTPELVCGRGGLRYRNTL